VSAPVLCFSPDNAPDARSRKNMEKAGIVVCIVPQPDRVISLHAAPVESGDIMAQAAIETVRTCRMHQDPRDLFGRVVLRLHLERAGVPTEEPTS
jgi:hypothetical protein